MVYLYENKLPTKDTIVIGKVKEINNLGVLVNLPEYNDIEGYISYSEVSRKKRFKINNLMAVGKEILLITLNVDEESKNIDLSKRSINDEEISLFTETYKKYRQLFTLWRYVYLKLNNINVCEENIVNINVDNLYTFLNNTLWKLQKQYTDDELHECIIDNKKYHIFNDLGENCDEIKNIIEDYTSKKIVKILPSKTIDMVLYSYNETGNIDIKYALDYKNFLNNSHLEKYNVDIKYMTNSKYNLHIKLIDIKNIDNDNIEELTCEILNEISKRSKEKNIIMNHNN